MAVHPLYLVSLSCPRQHPESPPASNDDAHCKSQREPTTHCLCLFGSPNHPLLVVLNSDGLMSFPGVVLESATHRTLHAQGFSRSSAQASLVLTDLFSRYLTLLSSTCAKYAQHAGRTSLTARDAFSVLDELGVGVDELAEYCVSEGREMRRFALHTARRVEDLNELKAQNADGLRQYHDDAMPLVYAPVSNAILDESDEDEEEAGCEEQNAKPQYSYDDDSESMALDLPPSVEQNPISWWTEKSTQPSLSTPPLPLSPISNPSSPTRKRARPSRWPAPDYIPDFFPPFPNERDSIDQPLPPPPPHMPPVQLPPARIEKPPSPIPQPLASTSAPDYLTRVPYEQSTLSATPEWHLPPTLPIPHPSLAKSTRVSTPQTEPSFIAAYHHILTHPPPPSVNFANPSRHKVAMALLAKTQTASRWDPPDTLYSNGAPCAPRVAAMSPTFPIPAAKGAPPTSTDVKVDDPKFPATPGKCVVAQERLSPSVTQQASRIPELARAILSTTVHTRTSRLAHPSVLVNNGQKLIYGSGVPAPWNSTAAVPTPVPKPPTPSVKPKQGATINGIVNDKGKESVKPTLPDALLFATWDYDKKDYRHAFAPGRRTRMGSIQSGSNTILSLGAGARSRQGSHGSKLG